MKNLVLYILFITVCACSGPLEEREPYPQYYHLIRQAKSAGLRGDVGEAIAAFEEARSLVSYTHTDNFIWAAFLALETNDCEKALLYYSKGVEQGFEFSKWDYSKLKECPGWTSEYEQKLFQLLSDSEQRMNQELSEKIDSVYLVDQRIRQNEVSPEEFRRIDSLNMSEIRKIIKDHGYPDERLVGWESAENAFIIMLHFDEDKGNKILGPILEDALYSGKLSPQNYAWVIDRRLSWSEERKEPFYYHLPTKAFFELTAEQKEIIDKRRYEIGLKPLSEMNVTLSPNGTIMVEE